MLMPGFAQMLSPDSSNGYVGVMSAVIVYVLVGYAGSNGVKEL